MGRTIYASFADTSSAEKAAGALLDHGVRAEDISLVSHQDEDTYNARASSDYAVGDRAVGGIADDLGTPTRPIDDYSSTSDISSESNTGVNRVTTEYDADDINRGVTTDLESANVNRGSSTGGFDDSDLSAKSGISTTTGADAGAGAVKGAAVGVGVGVLAALAAVFVPGFGLVWGTGALATALGGVAAATGAGAAAGALTGFLKDQGVDETAAQTYGETISTGGAVLAITVPSGDCDEAEAQQVLSKYGASNVNAYGSSVAA